MVSLNCVGLNELPPFLFISQCSFELTPKGCRRYRQNSDNVKPTERIESRQQRSLNRIDENLL